MSFSVPDLDIGKDHLMQTITESTASGSFVQLYHTLTVKGDTLVYDMDTSDCYSEGVNDVDPEPMVISKQDAIDTVKGFINRFNDAIADLINLIVLIEKTDKFTTNYSDYVSDSSKNDDD